MARASIRTIFLIVFVLTLAGCSAASSLGGSARRDDRMLSPSPRSTAVATTAPAQAAASTPSSSSTTVAAPVATTAPASAATPTAARLDSTVESAIKSIIERANQEQQDAFSKGDPSIMKDTATSDYYAELVQINQDMANNGVSAIKLVNLEWGPITLTDATTAEATTFETWRTQFDDGTTDESRDRNVYKLIKENGTWKIQSDDHPDSEIDQPPGDTSPTTPGRAPTPPAIRPRQPGQSSNWSGYEATGGKFTGVSGTWTVPRPNSTGRFSSGATWVGIGGVRSRDLIQAGTQETIVGPGQVRYNAWIELLPRASRTVPLAVSPGDSVSVSITEKGDGHWAITIKNNTTSKSYETTVDYDSSLSSAEWIHEAPSARRRVLPLDDFGTVQFTSGSAIKDGKSVTLAEAGAKPITMVDLQGDVLAKPSSLTADGSGFTISRAQSTASPSPRATVSPFDRRRVIPGAFPSGSTLGALQA